jgi:hypothetical protein
MNRGLFEPLVMYFGLTNSLATFQTMMNEIFQDLITEGVVSVYLDDILIFTNSLEEHCRIMRLVLDHMREHKLYLRPEKCEFEKTRIEYLCKGKDGQVPNIILDCRTRRFCSRLSTTSCDCDHNGHSNYLYYREDGRE